MPEPLTNESVPNTQEPSGQPVVSTERADIVKKYEAAYFQPEPVTEPVVTPAAAPVTEAIQPPQEAVPVVLADVMRELAALKSQLAPAPVTPVVSTATEAVQDDWLKLLSEGKKSEGELALARVLGPRIQEEAVQQALQRINMERELDTFATKIRQDNADLLPMESYIATAANVRVQQAVQAGTCKTPADYVKVYKEAVNAEVENARKLAQTLRGAGKVEATTRIAEVSTQQTIKPNAINMGRDQTTVTPTEPAVDPITDYFAKRKEQHAKLTGLA